VVVYSPASGSTTIDAEHMLRSFPGLLFGVSVGIGGGIPTHKNDIRLGDVVVGTPRGPFAGVIQYNFGRHNDLQFRRVGTLNDPPPSLLNAISTLEVEAIMERDSSIMKQLSRAISSNPRMKDAFAFPGAKNGLLFKAEYPHVSRDDTCNNCDRSCLIKRQERYSHTPMVHYGLIASGNFVGKDGKLRDQVAMDIDALCIGTDAAGLMNNFRYAVIR
jgi:hypothetical protein